MKKILVINVNWLGDVLFSTPTLKALRANEPDVYIACIVVSRCEEVLKSNPVINEIIVYDEYGKHRSFGAKFRFIRMLRKKKFDVVYVLHPSLKRAMIGYLAGIPERIGYDTKNRSFLLTRPIPAPDQQMHKIDYFLNLLKNCGIKTDDRKCDFFISSEDEEKAQALLESKGLKDGEKTVLINPGGNWLLKRWPVEYFAKLANILNEKQKVKIIIAGAKKDYDLAKEIADKMIREPIIVTGQTNLPELAAVMKRAACVVSADSGPMHIASAFGVNTVAVFGPTAADLTGPIGNAKTVILQKDIGCEIPCYQLSCVDNKCMKAVSPEEVADTVNKFME
ncbi:MAG: lipopolysaccharide heptosyltransferase II [PVC group bacterium]|nr:lipopolysaccharide heptosyltransferase II [PVC group bacterium]